MPALLSCGTVPQTDGRPAGSRRPWAEGLPPSPRHVFPPFRGIRRFRPERTGFSTRLSARISTGFTLIELLVVLVIAGAALALVVVQATPNEQSRLRDDADKIAHLFALADEEAQLRAQPLAWEGDVRGWRFQTQRGNEPPVLQQDVLAPGAWARPLDAVRLTRGTTAVPPRLLFGEETISQPFRLTLVRDGLSTTVVGDGAGTYRTETP